MKRKMIVIGLAALSALAPTAMGVAPASAATSGATAYTCVPGGNGGHGTTFKTAHCTEPSGAGEFGHLAIAADESTTLTTSAEENTILTAKLFGATVTLEATGLECLECTVHNHLAGEVHEVIGANGRLKFTNVTIPGFPNCEVVEDEPGKANSRTIVTEPIKFTTTSAGSVKLEPELGATLTTFAIKQIASTCNVAGTFKITGTATGSLNGSTLRFNITRASEELKLEGEKAALVGKAALTAGKPGSGTHIALALTEAPPF